MGESPNDHQLTSARQTDIQTDRDLPMEGAVESHQGAQQNIGRENET